MTKLILGIDPGSLVTGYGIIENGNRHPRLVTCGIIKNSQGISLERRLQRIYHELSEIIEMYHPVEMAIEDIFHARNARSALILGHVRGVCLLVAANLGLSIYKYSATTIKQSLTGNGRADKKQVQYMVKYLLNHHGSMNLNASDALAVALCHVHHGSIHRLTVLEQGY